MNPRQLYKVVAVVLWGLLLLGCGLGQPAGEPVFCPDAAPVQKWASRPAASDPEEDPPTESGPLPEPDAASLAVDDPRGFTLWVCHSNFRDRFYVPYPTPVENELDGEALAQMIYGRDAYQYCPEGGLELLVYGSTVAVNAKFGYYGGYASCWATITQNCGWVEEVLFLQEGEPMGLRSYSDENGVCTLTELTPPPYTREELASLRSAVPPQPAPDLYGAPAREGVYPFLSDGESVRVANYLSHVVEKLNLPAHSFDSPARAPMEFLIKASVNASEPLRYRGAEDPETAPYYLAHRETLDILADFNLDFNIHYLREHVDAGCAALFGEEATLDHRTVPMWSFNEYAGVYAPRQMEYYESYLPVLLEKTREGPLLILSVVYVPGSVDGWRDGDGRPLEGRELADHCLTLPRHTVTLLEREDGSYEYRSHSLAQGEGP